ncbi:MAG TPA: hypothetical protein VFM05_08755 [Candidatus Saccharimonadales bacterium]|nr:hypothetical protein [Candidatus Saccharimonadales bacterium]
MTYLIIGLTTLIVLMILFWWWGKRPARHRINLAQGNFRRYMEALLSRGYDRGFMIIEAPDRRRFIQFSKYIKNETGAGLQFDFPLVPWSEEYFEPLKAVLDQRSYKCQIEHVNPSPKHEVKNQVREFLVIDLEQDLEKASELSKLVFLEVFKLKPSDMVTLWFVNISINDERIGF